jgi:hypothetical protein
LCTGEVDMHRGRDQVYEKTSGGRDPRVHVMARGFDQFVARG